MVRAVGGAPGDAAGGNALVVRAAGGNANGQQDDAGEEAGKGAGQGNPLLFSERKWIA